METKRKNTEITCQMKYSYFLYFFDNMNLNYKLYLHLIKIRVRFKTVESYTESSMFRATTSSQHQE